MIDTVPSPRFRGGLIAAGVAMLLIWGVALIPAWGSWSNPRADGFEAIPAFWASISMLPLGVSAILGGISGSLKGIQRARLHCLIGLGLLGLVAALEIFRNICIAMNW